MSEASKRWAKKNPEKVAEIKRRFRARHKERIAAERSAAFQADKARHYTSVKKWVAANPDKVAMQAVRRRIREMAKKGIGPGLKFHYSVTAEQYEAINAAQNGVCAICGQPQNGKRTKRLFVDHHHATGRLRALLCHSCNIGIGALRERADLLARAAAYLKLFEGESSGEPWDVDVIRVLNQGRFLDHL